MISDVLDRALRAHVVALPNLGETLTVRESLIEEHITVEILCRRGGFGRLGFIEACAPTAV